MKKYKYMRSDFGRLPVRLLHMDMFLNFIEDRVEVKNALELKANKDIENLVLDADELNIKKITWSGKELEYEYKGKKLMIKLSRTVKAGETFRIMTETICFPSDTILEGIYKDATPKGAPQQYMSQCEHWGFERIAPVIDDCREKCTMTTTIEADARYTHLISNGNISKETNPDGRPV